MSQVRVLDVRGLEAPEPLERVLDALSTLPPGGILKMRIDREPRPLYRILERNGYRFQVQAHEDGLHDILIQHGA
jgi:TusA-related sulfurtransferase